MCSFEARSSFSIYMLIKYWLTPKLIDMRLLVHERLRLFAGYTSISAAGALIALGLTLTVFSTETSFASIEGKFAYQAQPEAIAVGKPFTPAQIEALIPATVYFRGKTAQVQLRNAGGMRFANDGIFFAVMVDTSGYSSSVQETYQFYLVTEKAVRFGGQLLQPGAYGAGFLNSRFIVMDIGGKTVLQGDTIEDKELKRPRPLQVLASPENGLRLYLGRRYVLIAAAQ